MSSGSSDSSETSGAADDHDAGGGNIIVKLKDIHGDVVVGGKRAKIRGRRETKGGERRDLPNASSSTTQSPSPLNGASPYKEIRTNGVQDENVIENDEYIPGKYCQTNGYKRQYGEREGKWNPRPGKGTFVNKGDKEFQWTIESVMDNLDRFIQEMDMSVGLRKEQREQFILHTLKDLEELWGKCASYHDEVYKILGKISCSMNSDMVVRHALQLFLHLICKDNLCNGNRNLRVVEEILRSAIFSSKGMFKKDQHSEQNLKLIVYSRILALLLVQQVRQEKLPIAALEQDLKKAQEELRKCCAKVENKKKDYFRYSMEFILQTISHLLTPYDKLITSTKLSCFLEECQTFCANPEIESKDLKVIDTFGKKKSGEWSVLHCILIYLHGKVHSERPVGQMRTERRAMNLIRLIVEAYLQVGGGADWKFCLLVSSLLADIAKNNATEEIIKEAGCCLVHVLKDKKVQKRPECRKLLERRSSELLFCPDSSTRILLVHFLSKNQHVQDTLPTDLHTDHLTSMYRTQTLEIDTEPTINGQACFVKQGMFQRRKVAVKILSVKRQHLVEKDHMFQSRKRLIREAYNLKRLNASQHRNLPVLLGYNTENLPYHIITVYETWGDLLDFVRGSRKSIHHLQPIQLLKMLTDISDALLHLEGLNLVHRAIMAENVLVGDSYVCKLSGLHALKQLTFGTSKRATASSLYDYCSADDSTPAFVSTDNDEEDEQLPVRWKAPESLAEHRYSTASDVWALGVLMYEVLTYGCIPYRHVLHDDEIPSQVLNRKETLPYESCFEDEEYQLIKQCCEWHIQKRIRSSEVNSRLKKLIKNADEAQLRPREPPPLEMLQNIAGSCNNEDHDKEEPIYSSIADYEEYNSQSGDCPIIKTVKGLSKICERIAGVDNQHLKALARLNNPNLASISIQHLGSHCSTVEIISPASRFGNLKEYVLNRHCQQGDIVTFLSQIASALHYLHTKNIVHGDLRAVHVNVVRSDKLKVQVGRLGRSKSLSMSAYDVTSTSCVVEAEMPRDAIRWSAPEVNLDGHYTHASDVWAFGILAWELYTSFTTGQDRRPYNHLQDDEILQHMRNKGPLDPPEGCPDWVKIIMHQCWAYESVQRPPFLAILDCLTSREPMKSWIMELWLQNHKKDEWPDLRIRQTDAIHVTDADKHPTRENIEKMCSTDFFIKHNYKYVSTPSVDEGDDEYYASCSSEGGSLDRHLGYHEPYIDRIEKRINTEERRGAKSSHETKGHCRSKNTALHRLDATKSEALSECIDDPTSPSHSEKEDYEDYEAHEEYETSGNLCPVKEQGAESVVTEGHEAMENVYDEAVAPTYSAKSSYSYFVKRKGDERDKSNEATSFSHPGIAEDMYEELPEVVTRAQAVSAPAHNVCDPANCEPHSCKKGSPDTLEEAPAPMVYDMSGYLCPVERKCDESNDTKRTPCEELTSHSLYYSSADVRGSTRSHGSNGYEWNAEDITSRILRRNKALSTSNAKAPGYSHSKKMKVEDHHGEPLALINNETSGEKIGNEGIDTKCNIVNELTNNSVHYSSVNVVEWNVNCKSGHSSKTRNDVSYCELKMEKNCIVDYQPLTLSRDRSTIYQNEDNTRLREQQNDMNEDDSSSYDDVIGCISEDRRRFDDFSKDTTRLGEYLNMRCKLDKEDDYDDVIGFLTEDNTRLVEFSAGNRFLGEYQNIADALDGDDNSIYDDVIGFPTNGDAHGNNVINEQDNAHLGNNQNMEQDDNTMYDKLQRHVEENALLGQCQNVTCVMDHDDSSMYDTLQQPNEQNNTHLGQYQNQANKLAQYNNTIQRGAEDNTHLDEFRNMACTIDHGDSNVYDQLQRNTGCNTHADEHQNMVCVLDLGDSSMYDKLERNTGNDKHVDEQQNMTCAQNQGDSSTYDKLERNTGFNTHVDEYQNMGCALDQGDSSAYDKLERNTQERKHLVESQGTKSVGLLEGNDKHKHQRNVKVSSYQNTAYFQTIPLRVSSNKETKTSVPSTQAKKKRKSNLSRNKENVKSRSAQRHMHVSRGEHVYANAQMTFETGHSNTQDSLQEQSLLTKINDPDLDIIYC